MEKTLRGFRRDEEGVEDTISDDLDFFYFLISLIDILHIDASA